ncbi:MAG TPA: hypothetical protein VM049_04365 [Gaiellaceae bacterium]|nr:hypothetical protein [Gaiellaceae bacterium]
MQRAAENTERKHHKGKARKEKKPKQEHVREEAVDAPAVADPAQELEPPLDDPESTGREPDAWPEDNHGKTHGGDGKGHEKKN